MTELSFLIELLLNHDLPKETKDLIASRIKEVEQNLTFPQHIVTSNHAVSQWPTNVPKQAASTLALMAKHGDIQTPYIPIIAETSEPVAQVAQTPQAAAAMNSRATAIAESIAGKVDKVTGRPKKW